MKVWDRAGIELPTPGTEFCIANNAVEARFWTAHFFKQRMTQLKSN